MRFLFSILTAAMMFAAAAHAEDYKVGYIQIVHPWTKSTESGTKNGAGYMKLTNNGGRTDHLKSVSSPIAKSAEVHIKKNESMPDGLALPPGKTVELKPGGHYIVLKGLTRPIIKDDEVPVTLTFERAGKVEIALPAVAQSTRDTRGGGRDQGRGR